MRSESKYEDDGGEKYVRMSDKLQERTCDGADKSDVI